MMPHDPTSVFSVAATLFFVLLIGHVVADYPLQGKFLSLAKNRHANLSELFGSDTPPRGLWLHALTAHSLIHAGTVWLVTGSMVLGLVELVLHWLIDFARCEKWMNFTTDQLLHIACKAVYVALVSYEIM
jgi:hypothetical protein